MTEKEYDTRAILKLLAIMAGCMFVLKISGGQLAVLFFPVLLFILGQKRVDALVTLLMVMLAFSITNIQLVPKPLAFLMTLRISYFLISFFLITQNAGRKFNRLITVFFPLLFYIMYMAIVSIWGWQPVISELKILLFLIVFVAMLVTTNSATLVQVSEVNIRTIFLSLSIYFIFGSAILYFVPSIGFSMLERWGGDASSILQVSGIRLFSGITWHSQSLGPLIAIFSGLLIMDYTLGIQRKSWLYRSLILLCPILIYMTSSRTAMGTYLVSCILSIYFIMKARGVSASLKSQIFSGVSVILLLGMVVVSTVPSIRNVVFAFIFKTSTEQIAGGDITAGGMEQILSSRQGLADRAMYNFWKSPLIGNGFQVSDHMAGVKVKKISMLLSAPIEKGFMPAAVLEEGGIFGGIIMIIFIISLYIKLNGYQAFCGLLVMLLLLISNLGEFYFFSMSGGGGLIWGLVFLGIMLDSKRLQRVHKLSI